MKLGVLTNLYGDRPLAEVLPKLKELGVPKDVRNEVMMNFNIICILMMVPAGLSFLAMARISRKRRLKQKAESVAAGE